MEQNTEIERIARLEGSITSIEVDMGEIRTALRTIQSAISRGKETNWSVIIAGAALTLMLYAAAIRPLNADVARQEKTAEALAAAVLVQNKDFNQLQNNFTELKAQANNNTSKIDFIEEHGTREADKRLFLIEYLLKIKNNP